MSSTASVSNADHAPATEKSRSVGEADEYPDAEKNFQPKSLKFWTIMMGIYLSIFLVALDRTILATAIPKITDEFNSTDDIGWYGSAYMLTAACFTPITGRAYQLYSTKWAFILSILVFEIGSAICGAAPSSTAFIVGRAIAGIGSAGIYSGGMMLIIPMVPLRRRPTFSAIFGISFGVSSVLGPIVGGAFTDGATWRWCFYLNLPIGAFILLGMVFFLHLESPKRPKLSILAQIKRLDALGIIFLIPSMVCLILALQWGGTTYSWSSPTIIGILVAFAVLFIGFIVVEVLTPDTAMAPTRVILNRSIASSMLFVFLLSGGLMLIINYLTIWFQSAKGDSAIHAGVSTIPLVLSLVLFNIPTAIFIEKIGYYVPAMLVSPILSAIGAGLLSTLSPTSNHRYWIGYQVLYGLGVGCGLPTTNLAAQTVLPRADVPLGLALMFFMQQLGGAIFLSIGQNVFSNKLVGRLSGVAGLDTESILNTGATDLRKVVPSDELLTVMSAYSYALTKTFIVAAALSACMILGALAVEWKSIKGKNIGHDGGAEIEGGKGEIDK